MNKKFPLIAATSLIVASQAVLAALPTTANLTFSNGVNSCVVGGTYPICTYGVSTVSSGSWFSMDTNDDGVVQDNEKIAVGLNRGIVIGIAQDATGNHTGTPTGGENSNIDLPWLFLGNTGVHKTPNSGITINSGDDGSGDGIAMLDFTDWAMGWGASSVIPLGGDSVNFPGDSGVATMQCYSTAALRDAGGVPDGACSEGDFYTLDYSAHVPLNDTSGLSSIGYSLHLVGQQIAVPYVSVSINVTNGLVQECDMANGTWVDAASNVTLDPTDEVVGISWMLDGQSVATGTYFNEFLGVGSHQVEVSVTTINGASGAGVKAVTVEDTLPPVVSAQFTNKLTGTPITVLQPYQNLVSMAADVSDVCDPAVAVTDVMYGTQTADAGYFMAYGYSGGLVIPRSQLELLVEATDASGNVAIGTALVAGP